MNLGLLAIGAVLLYFGAEWFVQGASRLALALRIPQLVVGLTVVAYGTSAPEVVVGLAAATSGHGEVALANVLGSNVANVGLILGSTLWVRAAVLDPAIRRRELPVLLLCTGVLPLLVRDGQVGRLEGVALLAAAVVYTAAMVRAARGGHGAAAVDVAVEADAADAAGAPSSRSEGHAAATAAVGLGAILLGGRWFVDGAVGLAASLGLSGRLVGLTVVAVGTSLPELVTSVVAARRGHADIAIGNVIGSNIFNILLCLGACAVARPIAVVPSELGLELGAVIGFTMVVAALMARSARLSRGTGALLLGAYAVFMVAVGLRG